MATKIIVTQTEPSLLNKESVTTPKFRSELEKKVFYRFVEMRAHQLWHDEGKPEGKSKLHWSQAEVELAVRWKGEDFPVKEEFRIPSANPISVEKRVIKAE